MPDPKNEAFLQREAEREKQRRSANRQAWLKLGKQTIRFLFVAGCAGIGICIFVCFIVHMLVCTYRFNENRCTEKIVYDNYDQYCFCGDSLHLRSYPCYTMTICYDAENYRFDDQNEAEDAYTYLADNDGFLSATITETTGSFWDSLNCTGLTALNVTITETTGSFWDPNSEVTDISCKFILSPSLIQLRLCYLTAMSQYDEDHFFSELHTYDEFCEISRNGNATNEAWYGAFVTNEGIGDSAIPFDSYYGQLHSRWSSYCISSGHSQLSGITLYLLSPEDIIQLAIAEENDDTSPINIDLSKYAEYSRYSAYS